MIPDVQARPWGGPVLAYLADPDARITAAVHLHADGTATASLHPFDGGPARDLRDPAAPECPMAAPLPFLLAVLALVLPALQGRERATLEAIRAHPDCPAAHAPSAHDRLAEAGRADAPLFLRAP